MGAEVGAPLITLALRYLGSRKKQTILMLLGIFFGAASFVTISGFMLGFREYFVTQLVNNNAHIHITAQEEVLKAPELETLLFGERKVLWANLPEHRRDSQSIASPREWMERLRADPKVVAATPQFASPVVIRYGTTSVSANLVGTNPDLQTKVTNLGRFMKAGSFESLGLGGNRIILGQELRSKLGVPFDQTIFVSAGGGKAQPFRVVGIFDTGNRMSDLVAFSSLEEVQKLAGKPNVVNEVAVKVQDYTQAAVLARIWSKTSEDKVESWDQIYSNIFEVFKIQDAVRYLSIGAIMIVAGFGIYNVLNMTVMQKRKDIAILKSMGYSTGDIVQLFFVQGLLLGVVGSALGLAFGYFFCKYLETLPFVGGGMGKGAGKFVVSFSPAIYMQAAVLALGASVFASLWPAISAGRLHPMTILRSTTE